MIGLGRELLRSWRRGHPGALDNVAHLLGKPVEQVRRVLRYNEHVTALDAPLDRDGGVSVAEGCSGGTIRVRSRCEGLRRGTTLSVVLPVGPTPAEAN